MVVASLQNANKNIATQVQKNFFGISEEFTRMKLEKVFPDADPVVIDAMIKMLYNPVAIALTDARKLIKDAFIKFEEDFPGLSSRFMRFFDENITDKTSGFTMRGDLQASISARLPGGLSSGRDRELENLKKLGAEFLTLNPQVASLVTRFLEFRESLANSSQTAEGVTKTSDSLYKSLAKVVQELEKGDEEAQGYAAQLKLAFGATDSLTGKAIDAAKAIAGLSDILKKEFSKELSAANNVWKVVNMETGALLDKAVNREQRRFDLLERGLEIEKVRKRLMSQKGVDNIQWTQGGPRMTPITAEEQRAENLRQVELQFSKQELDLATQTSAILTGMYEKVLNDLEKITNELDKQIAKEESMLKILQTKVEIGKSQRIIQEETLKIKEADAALSLKGKEFAASEEKNAAKNIRLARVRRGFLKDITNEIGEQNSYLKDTLGTREMINGYEWGSVKFIQQQVDYILQQIDAQLELNQLAKDKLAIEAAISAENKRRSLQLKQDIASEFSNLFTEKDIQGFEIGQLKINVEEATALLKILEDARKKDEKIIEDRLRAQKDQIRLEATMAEDQRLLDEQKYKNGLALQKIEKENIDRQLAQGPGLNPFDAVTREMIRVARLNQKIADEQVTTANKSRIDALNLRKIDIQNTVDTATQLQGHAEDLGSILYAHASDMSRVLGRGEIDEEDYKSKVTTDVKALEERAGAQIKRINGVIETIGAQTTAQIELNQQSADGKVADIESNRAIEKAKLEQRRIELDGIIELEGREISAFEEAKTMIQRDKEMKTAAAESERDAALAAIDTAIRAAQQRKTAAEAELTAAKNFNEVVNNKFTRIVDTVSGAIQGRVSNAVRDLTAALNEGTLTMDSFKAGFKEFIFGIMQDIQAAILEELVTKLINNAISEISNSLVSSSGGFLSGIFGPASGGYAGRGSTIRRFAGGGGVFQRDRVPALLEPGEFVIRKPMAKAIGGPALERMKATGQMPAGKVEVNMINKGTPQTAQVEQKPQVDGKGIVIDIVLKDLQNNGPIKQAIRGGGRR